MILSFFVRLPKTKWSIELVKALLRLKINLDEWINSYLEGGACWGVTLWARLLRSRASIYLGLPLGAPFRLVVIWDRVEVRFHERFSMWKRQYICKGCRFTLIKSTISMSSHILFVIILYSKESQNEVGENSKEFSILDLPLWWVMGEGWSFERINGVGMNVCVIPFLLYMLALAISKEAWIASLWG